MVSQSANRTDPEVLLDGDRVDGRIYLFVYPENGIDSVQFYIDGALVKTENFAPFDLAGGGKSLANPFDTSKLSDGYHTVRARITKFNGTRETISADVRIY